MDPLGLVGTWDFRREVQDHRDGSEYAARGEATFAVEGDGRIRWAEHGTLTWSAGTTPVTRTLFLVRDDSDAAGWPSGWRVTFEDGRDFHPWTGAGVEHLCGRDLYEGGYESRYEGDFADGDEDGDEGPPGAPRSWDLTWRVRGPEKDYTMHTTYSRQGADSRHTAAHTSSRPEFLRPRLPGSEET